MRFPVPLVRGTLVRRYKRFLSDVDLDGGERVVAHCANPGSMIGLADPGAEVWLSPNRNPKAKLGWRWELVRVGEYLVGINTGHPNGIVAEAISAGRVPELAGYATLRREVKYGQGSRVDILLEDDRRPPCYVEVKNVHMKRDRDGSRGAAEFPDSVTVRGAKHLAELAAMARNGARAVMLYLVQRGDCDHFRIAADIDLGYATALTEASGHGIEAFCYACTVGEDGIELAGALPVLLR